LIARKNMKKLTSLAILFLFAATVSAQGGKAAIREIDAY
jgi:hypothetical protein